MPKTKNKKIVVAVSGGFDPIHIGHVRLFREAKAMGDELVVILNNDNWLANKKKRHIFMHQAERKAIIEALKPVDRVILTKHKKGDDDTSVCQALKEIKPDIFANGGDRKPGNLRTEEGRMCVKIGCREVFNIGGRKVQSSSKLIHNASK